MSRKGWSETAQAIAISVALALIIAGIAALLSGCAGYSVGVKVEHHSSAEDYYDVCENNLLGADVRIHLGHGPYAPELSLGLGWDVRGDPCQGSDPVGEAQFRFPVWVR